MQHDQLVEALDVLIEKRRESVKRDQNSLFSRYMEFLEKADTRSYFLSCTGWPQVENNPEKSPEHRLGFKAEELKRFFGIDTRCQSGGYFFRWGQKGICVNPSEHFFERFCSYGHHIWEIDFVLVTRDEGFLSKDLLLLHQLNRALNSHLLEFEEEPHVITYLLHPQAFMRYRDQLRPLFREERDSVIALETFTDFKEEELALSEEINCHFSQAKHQEHSPLCVRFSLTGQAKRQLGFLLDSGWDDSLTEFYSHVDLLIAQMGACSEEDVAKINLQKKSLGYFGMYTLLQKCPNLALVLATEFSSESGDIRIETLKKLRNECQTCNILPLENGLRFDLETLGFDLGRSHNVTPENVVVFRNGDFSPLSFSSADSVL